MIVHKVDGSDLAADAVALASERQGFATGAKLGEAEIIPITVDDPDGDIEFTGHKPWLTREDTAPAGDQVFWAGFVGPKWITRGEDVVYPNDAGRQWDISLVESSTVIVRRLLRPEETTTKRPSETVDQRVAWLLTTPGFAAVIDAGKVASSSVVLSAHDYGTGGQNGKTVLDHCSGAAGFNWGLRYRETTEDWELLFFDYKTSSLDQSALRVSNDPADFDFVSTFPANDDVRIGEVPDNVASGVELPYDGGTVYRTDATTAAAFAEIDQTAPSSWVKDAAVATALADHYLEQHSTEEEKVENLWIRVPAASVNIVKAGQLMHAKFSHGTTPWRTFRQARVLRKIVKVPENLDQEEYLLGLDLTPAEVEEVELVYSGIQITSPASGGFCGGVYGGGGLTQIGWCDDGDAPRSGATPYPKFGLFEYVGAADNRTGIRCLGSGTASVRYACSVVYVATGPLTYTAAVRKNGADAITGQHVTASGLGFHSWEWGGAAGVGTEITGTFDVAFDDVIDATFLSSSGTAPSALPTGVGNIAHWLWVTGYLAA